MRLKTPSDYCAEKVITEAQYAQALIIPSEIATVKNVGCVMPDGTRLLIVIHTHTFKIDGVQHTRKTYDLYMGEKVDAIIGQALGVFNKASVADHLMTALHPERKTTTAVA